MKILSLDLATTLGWATYIDGKIKYGNVEFHNKKFDGAGMRYLKFKCWLTEQHLDSDIIIYEGVRKHLADATDSQHVYGGWMAILQAWCEENKIPYTAEGVTTIKKYWTGKGNAKKDDMIKEARKRGFNPASHDEADALAVLHMGIDIFANLE